MGQLAFLFPGQGTQRPGMGKDLYHASAAARAVLDAAEDMMPGLKHLCFEGPSETLTRTDMASPALFAVETACFAAALEKGIRPDAMAGFSLGEWTACHAANMLPFEEAFSLVMRRGQWMQASAVKHPGSMAAVLRLNMHEVEALVKEYPGIYAVNFNAPGQTVVAGSLPELERFEQGLKERGGRSIRLNVGGAFHSPYMREAAEQLSKALAGANLRQPAFPVYSNLTALPYETADAREVLARQVASPVRFEESIVNMASAGVDAFLELGPGKVLSGLVAKILPSAETWQAEDLEGLSSAAAALKGRV